eukprot:SAG31_NODE_14798_length_787_cov_0.848837_2_plen_87_part_01
MDWPSYFQDFGRGLTHFFLKQTHVRHPYDKPFNKRIMPSNRNMLVTAAVSAVVARFIWRRQAGFPVRQKATLALWLVSHFLKLLSPV